jgi:hypothetical protein
VIFHLDGVISQNHHIIVIDAEVPAFFLAGRDVLGVFHRHITDICLFAKDHFKLFATQSALEYSTMAFDKGRLVYIKAGVQPKNNLKKQY